MITLTKSGNAIVFTFDDNDHYLNDGTIEVPVNSLTLVTDESQMATFKRSSTNDIFISARYDELGMSKSDLESWFKENACGSTGGGGVTSGDVETMISEATSGLAESSAVTEEISEAVSGKADTSAVTQSINAAVSGKADTSDVQTLSGDVSSLSGDVANKADTTAVTASINSAVSGKMDTSAFNTYSASTDARLSEDEEVTSAALNELNDALDDKADTSAVTESINAAVSGKADTSAVTQSINAAVSGKQDTLVSGTNIKTINSESLLGSGNIDIQGGGKAIEAGRGIAITTGATADTVSFNLPISATTAGTDSIILLAGMGNVTNSDARNCLIDGYYNTVKANDNIVFGSRNTFDTNSTSNFVIGTLNNLQGGNAFNTIIGSNNKLPHYQASGNFILGNYNDLKGNGERRIIIGKGLSALNFEEIATGKYNVSHSGSTDADKSLFSVGNGTSSAATHNAFEIRQNGDIYITSGGTDIKLQDNLGGGGVPESAFTAYTASTEARLAEDEEVTAAALNTLNTATAANTTALGGLKLVQLTQAQYDALTVKDASTLYFITNVVS